jgi:hypothetical protein
MRLKKEVLIAVMSQHEKITAGAWPQEHQQDGVVATSQLWHAPGKLRVKP